MFVNSIFFLSYKYYEEEKTLIRTDYIAEDLQALEDIYRFLDKALVGTHQQPGLMHLKEKNESI